MWLQQRRQARTIGVVVSTTMLVAAISAAIALEDRILALVTTSTSMALLAVVMEDKSRNADEGDLQGVTIVCDDDDGMVELYDADVVAAQRSAIDVRETMDGRGFGAFATKPIEAGACLGDYEGTLLDEKDFWERYDDGVGEYCITVDERFAIDGVETATRCRANGRFTPAIINHASSPTANVRRVVYPNRRRVVLFAARDIDIGQELLLNYGVQYWRGREDEIVES